MKARDIMTRDVLSVSIDDKVENVARLLVDNKISGVPVVDNKQQVVGMVTEKDLMIKARDLKIPFYVTLFDSIIFLENPLKFNEELRRYTAVKVRDIMTTKVVAVEEDTALSEIVDLLAKRKINRVPVVRNRKLVGIITRNDVLKALVNQNE